MTTNHLAVTRTAIGTATGTATATGQPRTRHRSTFIGRLVLGFLLTSLSAAALAVDVQVSKLDDDPDPVGRGGIVTYTIDVRNNGSDTAAGVELVFPLPAGTTYNSDDNADCSHAGGTPGEVTCNYGSVVGNTAPGGGDIKTVNIQVNVPSTIATGTINGITATVSTTDSDTNIANNTETQNTTVQNGADLVPVFVSASPDPVTGGGNVTYVANVLNNGPDEALNPQVVFQLSPNATFVSVSDDDWTCTHDGTTPGGKLTCNRTSLASGATSSQISFVTQVTGAATGTLTTTATTNLGNSSTVTDANPNNDFVDIDVTVGAGTDIAVTVQNPGAVIAGDTFNLIIQPRNNGPIAAVNPKVIIPIPAGFTINSATGTGWNCTISGQEVTCNGTTLTVGATDNITVSLTAPIVTAQETYTNPPSATISSDTSDADATNNSRTGTIVVNPNGLDIEMLKTKGPNPVALGSTITSSIRVRNKGPLSTLSGTITITDTLLAGETFGSASGTGWDCSTTTISAGDVGDIVCTYDAALNNGSLSEPLTITTTATTIGDRTNTACSVYSGTPGDYDDTNDCDSETVKATGPIADLQVSKSADRAILAANDPTVTYTITVTNAALNAAGSASAPVDGITIEDDLPVYVSYNGGSGVTAVVDTTGVAATFDPCSITDGKISCKQSTGSDPLAAGE
ncbi:MULTISPECIES: DUF11 domain-containing protein [Thiorhodovibrio]|uniref:DUF11 domain-containing protein n=1 Tax=Thiorhodovibrio TaxID=61593 RepID=UPI001911CC9C|nr:MULTISPECIES: DUF11 domain-containing protein [Thiorhodovibrio]MBK5967618.1 hypothetical protein [Thiorhodovibrio winogradskyi]WPL13077.1 hypothetical protein Thiosp_02865 [Thiorhodovibrio litoralis]